MRHELSGQINAGFLIWRIADLIKHRMLLCVRETAIVCPQVVIINL